MTSKMENVARFGKDDARFDEDGSGLEDDDTGSGKDDSRPKARKKILTFDESPPSCPYGFDDGYNGW